MTAAAGVVRREARQFARDVGGHGFFNRFDAGGVVDVDAFLQEAHERAHAHAASKQDGDAAVGEVIHGGEAAAVLVGAGRDDFGLHDGTVLNVDERVAVAVAEMGADLGFEAAGKNGRNGDFHDAFSLMGMILLRRPPRPRAS